MWELNGSRELDTRFVRYTRLELLFWSVYTLVEDECVY